jgi:hypothetical protein
MVWDCYFLSLSFGTRKNVRARASCLWIRRGLVLERDIIRKCQIGEVLCAKSY